MAVHNIVIVGANFAGIGTAHYLLRHTIPSLESKNKSTTYKVTLISSTTHFFWKIGAPRTLASPDLIPISQAFQPIEDGFTEYPSDRFALVLGSATKIDEGQKSVIIKPLASSVTTSIPYSILIIATGTTSTSPLWTLHGSHEDTINAFKKFHKDLPQASTILIAGGGPAGTETAGKSTPPSPSLQTQKPTNPTIGEIGTLYPKANTTILSGSKSLLPRLPSSIGSAAESKLSALGIQTIHNVKVTSSSTQSGAQSTTTTLQLSNNTSRTVDVYIDATGGRPNSAFLPKAWLNERGYVITDPKTLRGPADGVYAIGDVASYSSGTVIDVMYAIRPLASSVLIDLLSSSPGGGSGLPKQVEFKGMKDTQLVPIGPKGGVGAIMGWKVPSLMVWFVKSRTFMVEKIPGTVSGKDYIKA